MQVLQEGQYIKHQVYGLGIVTESDQERTRIDFESHGTKLFVTSLMSAELVGDAPDRPFKVKHRRKATGTSKKVAARR